MKPCLSQRTLAHWPVPVWSRGVALRGGFVYCFADMKGAIALVDASTGGITPVTTLPAAVSADLVRLSVAGSEFAAVVDHAGNAVLVGANGSVMSLPSVGDKVRAGLRSARTPDGRGLIALITATPSFRLLDASDGGQTLVDIAIRQFPEHLGQGVVAAPLLFRDGDRDKLFLATRFLLVYQVDLATGALDWSSPLSYGVDSDPVFDEVSGRIYFTTGESLDGAVSGFLYAYDPTARRIVWRSSLQGGADVRPLIVDWGGDRLVVTATLRDAAVYAFRAADGALVARAAIPETGRCSHTSGACIPVGYGAYHTQTAVCKVYAAPFAVIGRDDACEAAAVASCNGNLYLFRPGEALQVLPLPGPVRASPAALADNRVMLHAGDALLALTADNGRIAGAGAGSDAAFSLLQSPERIKTQISGELFWQIGRYGLKQIGKFTKKKVYY